MLTNSDRKELIEGRQLSGEHINEIYRIVRSSMQFPSPQDVYFMELWDEIIPVTYGRPAFQILSSHATRYMDEITHWILVWFDGCKFMVYDSLNMKTLTSEQREYLRFWNGGKNPAITYVVVQQQTNNVDCGLYAIANAIALLHSKSPASMMYDANKMRKHLIRIYDEGVLLLFPILHGESANRMPDVQVQREKFDERGTDHSIFDDHNYCKDVHVTATRTTDYIYCPEYGGYINEEDISIMYSGEVDMNENSNGRTHDKNIVVIEDHTYIPGCGKYISIPQLITFDEKRIKTFHCGQLCMECSFCKALHFGKERNNAGMYKNCCHYGKVSPETKCYPPLLKSLLTNHEQHKHFMSHIREYNSALSFASLGANIERMHSHGPYCYKIHGQLYHYISQTIINENESNAKYAQLYFLDTEKSTNIRMGNKNNEHLDAQLLKELDQLIRTINPYAQSFKMLKEIEDKIKTEGKVEDIHLSIRRDRNVDLRRYNLPTCNEIAAVFTSKDGEPPFERDFQVYPKSGNVLSHLNILSPNLDPMTYVLLFPFGESGWQPYKCSNTCSNIRKNITMLQYATSLLAIRSTFNQLLYAGKLLQQYVVDMYTRVEANNLNFIRKHQDKLRVESYKGLTDYLESQMNKEPNVDIGRKIILPSTFHGSQRNMRQKYLDAMSICTKFGPPDLFITFTCNANWPEIKENVYCGQTSNNRPDLITNVFKLKLDELLNDIVKQEIFGEVAAYVYTIEYQKRGLPHAHILIILTESNKITTPAQVDEIISADIPDKEMYPEIYGCIDAFMIHGPCGIHNVEAPCMNNEKKVCNKGFPKEFQTTTDMNVDAYTLYRRTPNNTIVKRNVVFDSRYVVPFNKQLLLKYRAHINVEHCATVKSIKYIFKYIYKGYDCAKISIQNEIIYDEIEEYLNTRYIGPCEGMWRLLEYHMHGRSHGVVRLVVHLELEQSVLFKRGGEKEALIEADKSHTTLTAWFELNKQSEESRKYRYIEIPYYYRFNNRKWIKRKQKHPDIVARIYHVSPKDIERFYLRLLLLHVVGAQSYIDLKTFNSKLYPTFKEAAIARGLTQNDAEWFAALQEMVRFQMPAEMRHAFAMICIFGAPTNVLELWTTFCIEMSSDLLLTYAEDFALQKALHDIENIFQVHNVSCTMYQLPLKPLSEIQCYEHEENCEPESTTQMAVNELIQSLNTAQMKVFTEIIDACEGRTDCKCFFIDGPGGSGKTYLYNTLINYLKINGQPVLSYASTGIAALLIDSGRTVHSGFKIPIPILETSISYMKVQSKEAKQLQKATLLIIDEASMLDNYILRCIDRLLNDIMQNEQPFGGKIVILGGDFRQTLPVILHSTRTIIIERCIKSSSLWSQFKYLTLEKNMRAQNQNQFNSWLLRIGEGKLVNNNSLPADFVELPQHMISTDIIKDIYGSEIKTSDELLTKVILTPKNKDALEINNKLLKLLPSEEKVYTSADVILDNDEETNFNYPIEFVHSLTPSGMPPHELKLKVGSVVMLIRNLNVTKGLCNGTRLIVQQLCEYSIIATVITGRKCNAMVVIPKIDLTPSDTLLPFAFKRRQLPVIPAFAMTINKSQGQTFTNIGIYLKEPVFSHGQLYTALSRARSGENIKIQIEEIAQTQGHITGDYKVFTQNIVFREIL